MTTPKVLIRSRKSKTYKRNKKTNNYIVYTQHLANLIPLICPTEFEIKETKETTVLSLIS